MIEEAARLFRQTAPVEDFELEGIVVRLDRGPLAESGDVTIFAYVEDRWRNVIVQLGVQAHDLRAAVACVGDLVKEGRNLRLFNPRHFEVLIKTQE